MIATTPLIFIKLMLIALCKSQMLINVNKIKTVVAVSDATAVYKLTIIVIIDRNFCFPFSIETIARHTAGKIYIIKALLPVRNHPESPANTSILDLLKKLSPKFRVVKQKKLNSRGFLTLSKPYM